MGLQSTEAAWLTIRTYLNPRGPGRTVEMALPASILQHYQTVIDYVQRTLTLANPGTFHPEGTLVPFRINPKTGLIAFDAVIEGNTYRTTIDARPTRGWSTILCPACRKEFDEARETLQL